MSIPIALRTDFDAAGLRREAKATRGAAQGRRLLASAEIYDGRTRTDAARIGGVIFRSRHRTLACSSRRLCAKEAAR